MKANVVIKIVDHETDGVFVFEKEEDAREGMAKQVKEFMTECEKDGIKIENAMYGDNIDFATVETINTIHCWELWTVDRVH